jgi:hypothetical protein
LFRLTDDPRVQKCSPAAIKALLSTLMPKRSALLLLLLLLAIPH